MTLAGKLAAIGAIASEIVAEGAVGLGWHVPALLVLGVLATEVISRAATSSLARQRQKIAQDEMRRQRAIFSTPPLSDEEAEVIASMRASEP